MAENVVGQVRRFRMPKQELIDNIRSVLNANEENIHCDHYQLADMVMILLTEATENSDVDDQIEISEGC
tara:strand:+ start:1369 stop:1575 length:207 start_codon:yes stop_codon:yes gene_type:complete